MCCWFKFPAVLTQLLRKLRNFQIDILLFSKVPQLLFQSTDFKIDPRAFTNPKEYSQMNF